LRDRSFGMDILRSAAIWSVMVGHISHWFNFSPDSFYIIKVAPLLLGVEPFFVLGGFLAAVSFNRMISENGSFPFDEVKSYWYRRWMRTLPNYFLFLTLNTVAFYVIVDQFQFDYRYLIFTQNLFSLAPKFFSVSWSLATQEWFYLLFPLVAFLLFRLKTPIPILITGGLFILVSLLFRLYYMSSLGFPSLEGFLRRVAVLRMDSVVVGVLIGTLYFKRHPLVTKNLFNFLLGSLGVVALSYFRREETFFSIQAIQAIYYPLFSMMLAITMPFLYEINKSSVRWINTSFEMTSKWSYSIYLCHVFLMDGMFLILTKLGLENHRPLIALASLFWVLAVFVCSAILYKYFEVPMMLRLKPKHRSTTFLTKK